MTGSTGSEGSRPGGTDRRIRAAGELDALAFDDRGLIPVVAQDAQHGNVLMVAWANREALDRTLESGFVHYWSRSREALWKKGETSGNVQELVSLHADCDWDTLLARVRQRGPACHTGEATCFGEGPGAGPSGRVLGELWSVLESRLRERPEGSYTTKLLDDENLRVKKLGEETAEVIAALSRGDPGVVEEAGDLIYHLMVALLAAGTSWDQVEEVLDRRRRG
jgi:phosphoribosyl-AMP cyclohydrolase / phosphoribosyl-ATP pyrophosphohydrolase